MPSWLKDAAPTILLAWPVITAAISLIYNLLDGVPRVHAALSILVKAGLDLPGMLDAIRRLLSGEMTTAAAAKRAASKVPPLTGFVLLGVLAHASSGCLKSKAPAQQVADVAEMQACIQAHWGQPIAELAGLCAGGEIAVAEDIVADIEAAIEILGPASPDASAMAATGFPYASDGVVMSKLAARRMHVLEARRSAP